MKQAKKIALINIHDYPRDKYTAYWEIRILEAPSEGYVWGVRIWQYDPHVLLEDVLNTAESKDDADTQAQTFVLTAMSKYERK